MVLISNPETTVGISMIKQISTYIIDGEGHISQGLKEVTKKKSEKLDELCSVELNLEESQ